MAAVPGTVRATSLTPPAGAEPAMPAIPPEDELGDVPPPALLPPTTPLLVPAGAVAVPPEAELGNVPPLALLPPATALLAPAGTGPAVLVEQRVDASKFLEEE